MRKIAFLFTLLVTALVCLLLPVLPVQAQAIRTFVSTAGSDNPSCSLASPCRHFSAAVAVTSAGGEVDALDPGGYGSFTISHAISIEGQGWSYVAPPNGGAAITINAGTNDKISIRGVSLNGVGASGTTTGIAFLAGGSLIIENSVVRNFTSDGIDFLPSATSKLSVSNTLAADNASNGIYVLPTGSGTVTAVFNHVEANNNTGNGIVVSGGNSTGTINAIVSESVAADNANGAGFFSFTSSGHAPTTFTVFHSVSANNDFGLVANGTGATLRVAQSMVTGNTNGWAVTDGVIASYDDNYIDGNGSNTGSLSPIFRQ